jgi:hypothetical protein
LGSPSHPELILPAGPFEVEIPAPPLSPQFTWPWYVSSTSRRRIAIGWVSARP